MRSDALSRADAGSFPKLVHGAAIPIDAEYAANHWDASRLGIATRRGRARPASTPSRRTGYATR